MAKPAGRVIARDPDTGALYLEGQILVKLRAESTPDLLQNLLRNEAGWIVDGSLQAGIYRVRFPSDADMAAKFDKKVTAFALVEAKFHRSNTAELTITIDNSVRPLHVPEAA